MKLGRDRVIASGSELVVELTQGEVPILALELMLLLRGFADLVCLASGAVQVALRLAAKSSTATTFIREVSGRLQCSLSRDNAEYLEVTLLRAYRDNMAAVNHVHIEGSLDGENFDLTLLFDVFRPPMTPEEAEKLIGR
jgi:hypothetical protein